MIMLMLMTMTTTIIILIIDVRSTAADPEKTNVLLIYRHYGIMVPTWSIWGTPGKPGETELLHFWASRAKEIYLLGGLTGPLGWHLGYIG